MANKTIAHNKPLRGEVQDSSVLENRTKPIKAEKEGQGNNRDSGLESVGLVVYGWQRQ